MRREIFTDDELHELDLGSDVLAFGRTDGIRCLTNMGNAPVPRPAGEVLLSSSPLDGEALPSDTTVWIR